MAVMRSRLLPVAAVLLLAGTCAFTFLAPTDVVRPVGTAPRATSAMSGAALSGVGATGALAAPASSLGRGDRVVVRNGKQYWEGEWICADCGYIYNERSFGQKFEDLQQGFKCPQCAAPRRRFARKLGDKIGTTLDGGDTPIIIFTAVCLLVVLGIAYYSLQ